MASQSRKRKHGQIDQPRTSSDINVSPIAGANNSNNVDSLCARCRSIGLEDIFTKDAAEKIGTFIADIGLIKRDWLKISCSFCRFLAHVVFSSGHENLSEDIEYSLRAFSSATAIGHIINRRNSSFMPKINKTSVLGLVKFEASNSQRPQLYAQEVLGRWGYIYPTSIANPTTHPQILGRIIKPDTINYAVIKNWIRFCMKHHVSTCKILEDTKIPALRVINCHSRKVVEAPKNCKYVAMSYVWGQKGKNADWSLSFSDSGVLPETLPAVIEDAMTVVRELDLEYLWIDRYCIVQDDREDVIRHMSVMDLIYNHAHVTIIAAAGDDPFYGLPGVGSRSRLPQQSVQIGNKTLLSTLPDPQERVKTSTWMTRAWVYQEALFSIRRLIFTDHQVYFECNNMHCYEAIDVPLEAFHTNDQRRFRTCVRHGVFRGGFGKRCWPLTSHIQKYTEKSLTYQSDILRGMLGIFRAFEKAKYPIHHAWGVPIEFDMDIVLWKKQATMSKQYAAYPWKLYASFARGLCWIPKSPAERRPEFPSWSWTGWACPILDWPSFESLNVQENPDVRFRVSLEDGRFAELKELYSFTGARNVVSKTSCSIEIDAWTIQISVVSEFSNSASTQENSGSEESPCEYYAKLNLKDETSVYSPLILSKMVIPGDPIEKDLINRKWDCIILGYRKQASRSPIVMVIEETDGMAERVGLVDFWSACVDVKDSQSAVVVDDRTIEKARRTVKLR